MINFLILSLLILITGVLVKLTFDFAEIADNRPLWNALNNRQKFIYMLFGGPIVWVMVPFVWGIIGLVIWSENSSNWIKRIASRLVNKFKD